ncbi:MAG: (2Fe-2S)-binding protein [Thermoplasmatota archaeon]
MTTPKTFLCRCEDITLDECVKAIHDGYDCFEDLKRFLGVGTGPCQGKACVQACMQLVADERRIPLDEVDVMTFRPPVRPIAFATLAAPDADDLATTNSTNDTKPDLRAIRGSAGGEAPK